MKLVDASSLDAEALAATEAVYRERFPDDLRSPFSDLLKDDVTVLMSDGHPAGFACARRLGPTDWVFVRYLAVRERGNGKGSHLWRLLCARWAAAGISHVVLDVEDPDEATGAELIERRRRIAFYERLGARVLPVLDYRPPQADGLPHPLRLLAARTEPGAEITAEPDQLAAAVYRYRYLITSG